MLTGDIVCLSLYLSSIQPVSLSVLLDFLFFSAFSHFDYLPFLLLKVIIFNISNPLLLICQLLCLITLKIILHYCNIDNSVKALNLNNKRTK